MMSFLWFVAGLTAGIGGVLGLVFWLDRAADQMERDEHGPDGAR